MLYTLGKQIRQVFARLGLRKLSRDRQEILLAFEYGMMLSDTAHKCSIELTPEIVKRAEDLIGKEFDSQTTSYNATHMVPNILAIFETN